MKVLILSAAIFAFAINSGFAAAGQPDAFTISGGSAYALPSTTGPTAIPVGTTGFTNALLTISKTRAYKFEFLGCGDAGFDNRFYLNGTDKFFDCKTSRIGDSFIANMKVDEVGPHSPFHFQSASELSGPSVFNGEGPLDGSYTNGVTYSNTSIFYTIDGSDSDPPAASGKAVLLGLADGGVPNDNDYQDLVVRISLPSEKEDHDKRR
jgi:hypothetical protein